MNETTIFHTINFVYSLFFHIKNLDTEFYYVGLFIYKDFN